MGRAWGAGVWGSVRKPEPVPGHCFGLSSEALQPAQGCHCQAPVAMCLLTPKIWWYSWLACRMGTVDVLVALAELQAHPSFAEPAESFGRGRVCPCHGSESWHCRMHFVRPSGSCLEQNWHRSAELLSR